MLIRSLLAVALVVALMPLTSGGDAAACSCFVTGDDEHVRRTIEGAEIMVAGEVVSIARGAPSVVELRVERVYKGAPSTTISYYEDGACGIGYTTAGVDRFVSLRERDGAYREMGCASFPLRDTNWSEFHDAVERLAPAGVPASANGGGSAWSLWFAIGIAAAAATVVAATIVKERRATAP